MIFSSLKVDGVYLVVTRCFNKYLITVHEIDKKGGKVLATRSTLDGKAVRTGWYSEGTVCNWRTRTAAINRQLANTDSLGLVLSGGGATSGHTGLHMDDPVGMGLQAVE